MVSMKELASYHHNFNSRKASIVAAQRKYCNSIRFGMCLKCTDADFTGLWNH